MELELKSELELESPKEEDEEISFYIYSKLSLIYIICYYNDDNIIRFTSMNLEEGGITKKEQNKQKKTLLKSINFSKFIQ